MDRFGNADYAPFAGYFLNVSYTKCVKRNGHIFLSPYLHFIEYSFCSFVHRILNQYFDLF